MATLTKDKARTYESGIEPIFNDLPVIASDIIYGGAAVGESTTTGTYKPFVTSDSFVGFAYEKADNSSGSASDINVRVRQRGVIKLTVTGTSAVTDHGVAVYAADDDDFHLTASLGTQIGVIARWVTGTTCMVYFEGAIVRSI